MPSTAIDPAAEAARLAGELRQDAAERELAAGTPKPQRDRLRASGLLKLMIPVAFGGLGVRPKRGGGQRCSGRTPFNGMD
jgi:alkylation response protein AidB-like acyl-CoA dehydrogenase